MKIAVFGLSITSSWGNGHATTYRGLLQELSRRGHDVQFFERDMPWYREHRDLRRSPYCSVWFYSRVGELSRHAAAVAEADAVIVGSYVPQGAEVIDWVLQQVRGTSAFYDIDTPVTLSRLARGDCEYIRPDQIPQFDRYLSFTGGPTLARIERTYGAQTASALYCSADPALYFPEQRPRPWRMGYLGTYSDDRQPALERLLLEPAARLPRDRFVVAGPLYPVGVKWPGNVERIDHLSPAEHRSFYNAQSYTLNLTRRDMVQAGWSPSVRLFEAAACGVPIITDAWEGLSEFFEPGREILVVQTAAEVRALLGDLPEAERQRIGERARQRVLAGHTAAHRARELEAMLFGGRTSRSSENPALIA